MHLELSQYYPKGVLTEEGVPLILSCLSEPLSLPFEAYMTTYEVHLTTFCSYISLGCKILTAETTTRVTNGPSLNLDCPRFNTENPASQEIPVLGKSG